MTCLTKILDAKYPQFNTTTPEHLLTDALYQMCCENVEYLIVLEADQFIGLLSEHDITQKILTADKPLNRLRVGDLMNRNLPVASATDSIDYTMQLLDRYNTRYLAIYDGLEFKGVVSETDLLKSAIDQFQLITVAEERAYPWNY
jgi:predicted transcriptional regulator